MFDMRSLIRVRSVGVKAVSKLGPGNRRAENAIERKWFLNN